jgi:hypothetical protein
MCARGMWWCATREPLWAHINWWPSRSDRVAELFLLICRKVVSHAPESPNNVYSVFNPASTERAIGKMLNCFLIQRPHHCGRVNLLFCQMPDQTIRSQVGALRLSEEKK